MLERIVLWLINAPFHSASAIYHVATHTPFQADEKENVGINGTSKYCEVLRLVCNQMAKSCEILMFVSKKMPNNAVMPQSLIILIVLVYSHQR